jgi:hypothetical protein
MCVGAMPISAQPSNPDGRIARAQFSSKIEQREPVDAIHYLPDDASEVSFFTEVLYMTGNKLFHQWEKDGEILTSVSFDVGGPRWRVYSRIRLDNQTQGIWTVVVKDENDWPLLVKKFIHGEKVMLEYLKQMTSEQVSGESQGDALTTETATETATTSVAPLRAP